MEFREIEVGELTLEEMLLYKKVKSYKNNAQPFTGLLLFWKEIRKRHKLHKDSYYLIRNNKIYGYDIS